jgi:hypothetical protein
VFYLGYASTAYKITLYKTRSRQSNLHLRFVQFNRQQRTMAKFCTLSKVVAEVKGEKVKVDKLIVMVAEVSRVLLSKANNKRILVAVCDATSVARIVCFNEALFSVFEPGHLVRVLDSTFNASKMEFVVGGRKYMLILIS